MAEKMKDKVAQFREIPEVKTWVEGANLRPQTESYYVKRLMFFLDGEEPKAFLERALKASRETNIEIKGRISKTLTAHGPAAAVHTKAALQSWLNFYEVGIRLNGKIKLRRKWEKAYLTWENAEKIISRCREPYQGIFRFMLNDGIGSDEFLEMNNSPKIQDQIAKQMADSTKEYIIIDLEPRKSTLSRYYGAVPRNLVPKFPIKSLDYGEHGNQGITRELLEGRFRTASKSVGLHKMGAGPHVLRSAFRSQCAKVGVSQSVAEFMMGHGSSDEYGYDRQVLDEKYVIGEISKLQAPGITRDDLAERDRTIEGLKQRLAKLESVTTERLTLKKE